MNTAKTKRPAVLVIAEQVVEERCSGQYEEDQKTWSHRKFEFAATKKHNEAM